MNRFLLFILGPELYWILVYLGAHWLVTLNQPHTPEGAQQLETIGWFFTIGSVLLSFMPLMWAPGNRWFWLIRIALAGLIGSIAMIQYFIDKGFYPDPGIGMYGILLIGISLIILITGVVIIAFKWAF